MPKLLQNYGVNPSSFLELVTHLRLDLTLKPF